MIYNGTVVAEVKATENYDTHGVLYNRTAAMESELKGANIPDAVQGVCPTGWHMPSSDEWRELIN